MKSETKRTICLLVAIASILTIVGTVSYAYFTAAGSVKNQTAEITTGTISVKFADNDNGVNEQLNFGESVTKKFTIENTGTVDASIRLNWTNLINTYLEGSLTYTLFSSETEDGTYTEIISETNVPVSEEKSKHVLAETITVPEGKTIYYNLVIKLNYLEDVDQNPDINAKFSTTFGAEDVNTRTYRITFNPNGGTTPLDSKEVTYYGAYGELPTPTREDYNFLGWYTEPTGGVEVKSSTQVKITSDQILYAQWKFPLLTTTLLEKANNALITDYNSGNKGEMFAFTHPATAQTEALTDYRYIGSSPNNYIDFNDETWRIIGVFTVETESGSKEQLMKIIRDESIGNLVWNSSSNNEWSTASLRTLLNGEYYNTEGSFITTYYNTSGTAQTLSIPRGLSATARNQIANVKWYLGGSSTYENLGGPDYYAFERGTTTYQNSRTTSIVQKVGLMYPSDYIYTYANGVDNTCYTDTYNCRTSNGGNPANGWLFKNVTQWSMFPNAYFADSAFYANFYGHVSNNSVRSPNAVRPTVYLTSDVTIIGGDGSVGNHYKLG